MPRRFEKKRINNKIKKNEKGTDNYYLCLEVWARIIGMQPSEFMHMPIGELSDIVEMYQRIKGYAEADSANEGDYIPNLR